MNAILRTWPRLAVQDDIVGEATGYVQHAYEWLISPTGGIQIGFNVLKFIAVLIVAKIAARVLGSVVAAALSASKLKVSSLLREFFVNTTRKVVFLVGLVMALDELGLDVAPLIMGLGVAGFVIGFALQDSLSNFAAGVMILLYKPYDIGDVIEVAGVTGKVTDMSLVSTMLQTPDNQDLTVPNGSIWGGVIRNITANETRRVDMVFGIGYEDDIEKAEGILEELVTGHPLVLADPAPVIKVNELADSSVNFVVRPWTKTGDYWAVKWDLTRQVKLRFDAEGISIPYPQRDVHMHQTSE